MTPEEFYRQLRDEFWIPRLANADKGKHPPPNEIAGAIYELGIEAKSAAAAYVAQIIAGEIKRPKGNDGTQRSVRPDDSSLRLLYKIDLEDLQILRKTNPGKYAKLHGVSRPSAVAQKRLAKQFSIGEDTVRKAVHRRGD